MYSLLHSHVQPHIYICHAEPLPLRPPSSAGGSPGVGGSALRVRAVTAAGGSPAKPAALSPPALSTAVSTEALLDGIRV